MTRIGVDFGGTKIEAAALDSRGAFLSRKRAPNPRTYDGALRLVRDLVAAVETDADASGASVGVGMPGSMSPVTGMVRNANSTWLNDRPFDVDLAAVLQRPIRVANDANCFALSEAVDGAAAGARSVFGAILGTGCGGGLVVEGALLSGANAIAGEWGHTPLPWPSSDEIAAPVCWCGRRGCVETWLSGVGFSADYERSSGERAAGDVIMARARAGDPVAGAAFARYVDRLGRALAVVCDIFDPAVIVLGGGMSNIDEIYGPIGEVIARHVFSDSFCSPVRRAQHGDSSGVRGAAWLWPAP